MKSDIIESIQSSGYQAGIVISGGGFGAVQALLSHPGASRFVMNVRVPYSREAMNELLGFQPQSYCSEQTVQAMAEKAFEDVCRFKLAQPLGIACSAALHTNAKREDPDRAYICFYTCDQIKLHKVEFAGTARPEQEKELSQVLIEKLFGFSVV